MSQKKMEMELDIANILKGIAYWEITMENFRIRLAENPNFDPGRCFRRLDRTNDNKVEVSELQAFLSIHRIAATDPECEYLINLKAQTKGRMTDSSFFDTVLPMTNKSMKAQSIDRRLNWDKNNTYQKHFLSDEQVLEFSERKVAEFFGEEIKFLREIESLRKQFSAEFGRSVYEIFRDVDYKEKGQIDFDVLSGFLRKHKINFTQSEFEALLRRISRDFDDKIDYQELVNAMLPREPFSYPAFREDFNPDIEHIERYIVNKMKEFGCPLYIWESAKKEAPKLKNQTVNSTSKDPYYSFRKVFDPFRKGRNQYIYDQDYMKQFSHYREKYIEPNKVKNYKYAESDSGLRYHDHFFDDFYQYLYERDKGEEFFNRYGKRYVKEYDHAASSRNLLSTDRDLRFNRADREFDEDEENSGQKTKKRNYGDDHDELFTTARLEDYNRHK